MDLATWLLQQITVNGGAVHRDGDEEPIGGEELERELTRRLDGLTFRSRLTVDNCILVEALSAIRGDTSSCGIDVKDWWFREGPGRPATVERSVFSWFFYTLDPEWRRLQYQTTLVKEYQKTGLPGVESNITAAIAKAMEFDKGEGLLK
jgi:hypothetical protein